MVPTLKLELANLAFVTLASRILVVVTASVSIEALKATAPVPSNEIDEAVISPLIEKFCPEAKAVAVSALPVKPPTKVVDVTDVRPATVPTTSPNSITVEPRVNP